MARSENVECISYTWQLSKAEVMHPSDEGNGQNEEQA